ncbi:hypothetical protein HHL08_09400 [Sphingobium sp. AR-3-1]|uniref:Uncharacterized protein n=1 Tax=Sphingobium psychrophilum TaxID=2728834 RepID=A0A7X9WUW5_9SPHN|nr:hypothetical protein [Sphingobium psychrophilum]NML10364.1 hypothetical protein [Sphingobium psychrophilum]
MKIKLALENCSALKGFINVMEELVSVLYLPATHAIHTIDRDLERKEARAPLDPPSVYSIAIASQTVRT